MTIHKYNSTFRGRFVNFNKNVDFFSIPLLYIISHVVRGETYKNVAKGLFLKKNGIFQVGIS